MLLTSWLKDVLWHRRRSSAADLRSRRRSTSIPLFLTRLEERQVLSTFTVTTVVDTPDVNPGDGIAADVTGETSLRAALTEAEANPDSTTILFDPNLVAAGDVTLALNSFDSGTDAGEFGPTAFVISTPVNIIGPSGNEGVEISRASGATNFRLFHVQSSGSLTIENLTLTGGVARGGNGIDGGGGSAGMGGAVFNEGALTINASTFRSHLAIGGNSTGLGTGGGAGVAANGGPGPGGVGGGPNGATGAGLSGGFGGGGGGHATGNGGDGGFAAGGGAGLLSGGDGGFGGGGGRGASGSTNEFGGGDGSLTSGGGGAGMGGAIFNANGTLTISSSTFSGNAARGGLGSDAGSATDDGDGYGGAIFSVNGTTTVSHSTIAFNTVTAGSGAGLTTAFAGGILAMAGGLTADGLGDSGSLTINNSIVARSLPGPATFDLVAGALLPGGTFTVQGDRNLVEHAFGIPASSGVIDITSNPQLLPLADNGGPTVTHRLAPTSPAIDAAGTSTAGTDQRGRPRLFDDPAVTNFAGGSGTDMGAFELFRLIDPILVNVLDDTRDAFVGDGIAADSNGNISLRAAIMESQAEVDANIIGFDPALVAAGDATIELTLFDTGADAGELGPSAYVISTPISIVGPTGDHGIAIVRDGAASDFRLFHVQDSGNLTLEHLTLSAGVAMGFNGLGGGGGSAGMGGAIFNQGTVTVRNSTLNGNQAIGGSGSSIAGAGSGGGAGAAAGGAGGPNGSGGGPLGGMAPGGSGGFGGGGAGNVTGIGGNGGFAGGGGAGSTTGGIGGFGGGGGAGTASGGDGGFGGGAGSLLTGGGGAGMGGAIFNADGRLTIINSTLSGNAAQGGLGAAGASSTDDGNGFGGAIFSVNGYSTVESSTIAFNSVTAGSGSSLATAFAGGILGMAGGLTADGLGNSGSLTLNNSIVARSLPGADGFDLVVGALLPGGTFTTTGDRNLVPHAFGIPGGSGIIDITADPQLAPLSDNGGPTATHALTQLSPAIDAAGASLAADQRGRPRPADIDDAFYPNFAAGADIGSYEAGSPTPNVTLTIDQSAINENGGLATITASLDVATDFTVTIALDISGTAINGTDYATIPTQIVIAAGSTTGTVSIAAINESLVELDETVVVAIKSVTNGNEVGDQQVRTTIRNDDTAEFRITDVVLTEGNSGAALATFHVTLTNPVDTAVTIRAMTVDGTAVSTTSGTTGDSDFIAALRTLTFASGDVSESFAVTVNGDLIVELTETFTALLSNAQVAGRAVTIGDNSGTATILNNDSAVFNINDVTVTESNSGIVNAVFTISVTNQVDAAIAVDVTTQDQSGVSTTGGTVGDSDYVAQNRRLQFTAGETLKTFTVAVKGDAIVELNEFYNVLLGNEAVAGRSVTIGDGTGVGNIVNDDAATFAIDDVTVTEPDSGTVVAIFTVSLTQQVDTAISIDAATSDGTAVSTSAAVVGDTDFTSLAQTLGFAAGQTRRTFSVVVQGDNIVELTERFNVHTSNAQVSGRNVSIGDATGDGTIVNDDAATININDVSLTETDSGTVTAVFNVTLTSQVDTAVMVQTATVDGTAVSTNGGIVGDADFAAQLRTLAFTAGDTLRTFSVIVRGDRVVELTEQFRVVLSDDSANGRAVSIGDGAGSATIVNDDSATIDIDDVIITETNSGTVDAVFTLTLSNQVDASVALDVTTADGTAVSSNTGVVGDRDFSAVADRLLFVAGDTTEQVRVAIRGDNIVELDEAFRVLMSNAAVQGRAVAIGDGVGDGTIVNDDQAELRITDVSLTETDGGTTNAVFQVSLSNPVDAAVTIDAATRDVTAVSTTAGIVGDTDYQRLARTIAFTPGETLQMFSVAVRGDTIVELTETFEVDLTSEQVAGRAVTVGDNLGRGTIRNDDSATLNISDVTVFEGDSGTTLATFNVSLTNQVDTAVSVNAATQDGSAVSTDGGLAGDRDFTSLSQRVSLNAGATSTTLTVAVNADRVVELDETFQALLSSAIVSGRSVTIGDGVGSGTIINDDAATFVISDASIVETNTGTTQALFTVTLSNPVDAPVSIRAMTSDGTAVSTVAGVVGEHDFTSVLRTLLFARGSTQQTVSVDVHGDTIVELNEVFQLLLDNEQVAGRAVSVLDGSGQGLITNDDSADITIDDITLVETNSGTLDAVFTISMSNQVDTAISIDAATLDRTAVSNAAGIAGDADYSAVSNTLVFTAGDTQRTVVVTIRGDRVIERTETFDINLTGTQTGGRAVTTSDVIGTGTIVNDDVGVITGVGGNVAEGDLLPFTLTLDLESAADITIVINTADLTATAGDDYVPVVNQTVTFVSGAGPDQTVTRSVPILDDDTIENEERLLLNLTDARFDGTADPSLVLIGDSSIVGTIRSDVLATITVNSITRSEGGTFTLTLTQDRNVTRDVTVVVNTRSVTAQAGVDFTEIVNRTIRFAANGGENQIQTVTFAVANDAIVEADEIFELVLSDARFDGLADPSRATIGTPTGTVTILNDDSAVITINDVSREETDTGTTRLQFDAILSAAVQGGLLLDFATVDGTAVSAAGTNRDFEAQASTLAFAGTAGEVQSIRIVVIRDTAFENGIDETFTVGLSNLRTTNPLIDADQFLAISGSPATGTIINDDTPTLVQVIGGQLIITDEVRAGKVDDLTIAFDPTTGEIVISDPNSVRGTPVLGTGSAVGSNEIRIDAARVTNGIVVATRAADDRLLVDLSRGNPIAGGGLTYDSGAGSDSLVLLGNPDVTSAVYVPSATMPGTGRVSLNDSPLTFRDVTSLDLGRMQIATLQTAGADDVLTVANGTDFRAPTESPALRVTGTRDGTAITPVAFFGNRHLVIDTASINDGNDAVTVASADNAHANASLTVLTGTGDDRVNGFGNIALTGALTIDSTDIVIDTPRITTGGDQNYNGPVNIQNDIALTGDSIAFAETIDAFDGTTPPANMVLTAQTDIDFNGPVGSRRPLGDVVITDARDVNVESTLTVDTLTQQTGSGRTTINGLATTAAADGIRIANDSIALTATGIIDSVNHAVFLNAENGDITLADGSQILAGAAVPQLTATGNISLGHVASDVRVDLRSTGGSILDGGDSNQDVVAPELVMQSAAGVGADGNAIDTAVDVIAAVNSGSGDLRISNQAPVGAGGNPLQIGAVDAVVGGTLHGILNAGGGTTSIGNAGTLIVGQENTADGNDVHNTNGGNIELSATNGGSIEAHSRIVVSDGDGGIALTAANNVLVTDSGVAPDLSTTGAASTISLAADNEVFLSRTPDSLNNSIQLSSATGLASRIPPFFSQESVDVPQIGISGDTTLTADIGAVGETNLSLVVFWGDGTSDNFTGLTTGTQTFEHIYTQEAAINRANPAEPFEITFDVLHDPLIIITGNSGSLDYTTTADPAFVSGTGLAEFPGEGSQTAFFFILETSAPLLSVPTSVTFTTTARTTAIEQTADSSTDESTRGESERTEERIVILRALSASGEQIGDDIELPEATLDNLVAVFRRLPDGRYRVYLREAGSPLLRLIIDVQIRQGRAGQVQDAPPDNVPPHDGLPGDGLPGDRLPGDRLPGDGAPPTTTPGDATSSNAALFNRTGAIEAVPRPNVLVERESVTQPVSTAVDRRFERFATAHRGRHTSTSLATDRSRQAAAIDDAMEHFASSHSRSDVLAESRTIPQARLK